ncbi:MAG TPA: C40 family peptidase [Chitinophagales bacterium]|nr:C40 family peptidase [Chitinophagales bacterium]
MMDVLKKVLSLIVCALLTCSVATAQDSLSTEVVSIKAGFPADLDSIKVDSFFRQHGIDLALAERPEVYYEIYRWYKTCYRYGGNTNKGIDCSHFVNMLYEKYYGRRLSSSSGSICTQCRLMKGGYEKAKEGDLVFFAIKKKRVSHVAIYLQNGKFAHATTQAGVIISDKDEPYYKRHFYRVGRAEE